MKKKNKPDRSKLLEICQNKPYIEAANYFNVSTATLDNWKREYQISKYDIKYGKFPIDLTIKQKNIVEGILLGDGCLLKIYDINSGLYYEQNINHKSYIESINEDLKPFARNLRYRKPRRSIIKEKEVWNKGSYAFITILSPIFTKLRNKWYPDEKKIIPPDLELNWEKIAYWFCDDGSNLLGERCIRRDGVICTNGFTFNDVELLILKLKKLNLDTKIRIDCGKPMILIPKDCFEYFIDNIKQFIPWECMKRKVRTQEPRVKIDGSHWTPEEKTQLQNLFYTNTTEKLASIFKRSIKSIQVKASKLGLKRIAAENSVK